jgi:hypothetical protein
VVINEILYAPISENEDDEFVELYNRTGQPVDISGWNFPSGIQYVFPAGTVIQANGYRVVAANRSRMLTNYPGLDPVIVSGNFEGKLSRGGERLALAMPEYEVVTNGVVLTTNVLYVDVHEVTYGRGGQWPSLAHGGEAVWS